MKNIAHLGVVLILMAGAGCQKGQTGKTNQPKASGDNAVTPCPAVLGNETLRKES